MVSLLKVLCFNRKFKCSLLASIFCYHFFSTSAVNSKVCMQTLKLTKRQYALIAGISLYLRE